MDYKFWGYAWAGLNSNAAAPLKFSPPPQGWWKLDGEWYLTADAAKRELHSKLKFETVPRNNKVFTQTVMNEHDRKSFTIYRAEDLGIGRRPELEEKDLVI